MAYLANNGHLDAWRQAVIAELMPKLRRSVARLGRPSPFPEAFQYFRLLLKMTELIHNYNTRLFDDAAPHLEPTGRGSQHS